MGEEDKRAKAPTLANTKWGMSSISNAEISFLFFIFEQGNIVLSLVQAAAVLLRRTIYVWQKVEHILNCYEMAG